MEWLLIAMLLMASVRTVPGLFADLVASSRRWHSLLGQRQLTCPTNDLVPDSIEAGALLKSSKRGPP